MDKMLTWDEMIKSIEELEQSLDTTHYITSEKWKNIAKRLNLHNE